jgi:hypothetical protein
MGGTWICNTCDSLNQYEPGKDCLICGGKIDPRSEEKCLYEMAQDLTETAASSKDFLLICECYSKIFSYKDARQRYSDCKFKAERLLLCETEYAEAKKHFQRASEYNIAQDWVRATEEFAVAEQKFQKNSDYLDSKQWVQNCRREAELCKSRQIYTRAKKLLFSAATVEDYTKAAELFGQIPDFNDAAENYQICQNFIGQLKAQQTLEKASKQYEQALRTQDHGARLQMLETILKDCSGYSQNPAFSQLLKDSTDAKTDAKKHLDYRRATELMHQESLAQCQQAAAIFLQLGSFLDSSAKRSECEEKAAVLAKQATYQSGLDAYETARKINLFNWRKYR